MTEPITPRRLELVHPRQIITERDAALLRGVSLDTFRRLVDRGDGPERLRVSSRRIGYRLEEVLNFKLEDK